MGVTGLARGGERVKAVQGWLVRRTDTPLGRLADRWFRAYFAASRNSACAVTIYSALSVLPTALVAVAFFHLSSSEANRFADRLVAHLRLNGATADLVHATFASASANATAATVAAVVGFLLWGVGIGQLFRDLYARAWELEYESTAADQVRFVVFFFVFTGTVALFVVSASALRASGWLVVSVAWLVGSLAFWLWVPWYLLHRAVALRALLPGALLAVVLIGGTVATAPLYLASSMNENGAAFGSFGVVLTIVAYVFILVTMSMACAVFAPVWHEWRRSERERKDAQ